MVISLWFEPLCIDLHGLEEMILSAVNAALPPEDRMTWAEYERKLAEEKRMAEIMLQLAKEEEQKARNKAILTTKVVEKEMATKVDEMTLRRWRASARQSQGDPSVISLAESVPVPPTVVNYQEVA